MHGDEGMLGADGIGVDGVSDEFLASAGFAGDENSGARGGYLADEVEDLEHALAFADDVGEAVALAEGAFQLGVFALQAALRDHAVDLDQEFFVIPGFRKIIVRAALEGGDGYFDRPVGGDQENRRFAVPHADFFEHFHAALVRHHQVEQDQIEGCGFQALETLSGVAR